MQNKLRITGLITFLFLFHLIFLPKYSEAANIIEEIHMDVTLNEDGSAHIVENRIANLTEGTENYIVIEDVGKSEIIDFTVAEDGEQYKYIDSWDIDATREEKAFKNGLIETSNGYELSWGIGDYGEHNYTIEYTVTNFIKQLTDSQILFWQFINPGMDAPPKNVTINIKADQSFSEENEKIWAFGFDGDINFFDGKIVAKSDQPLEKEQYLTILVQFTDEFFIAEDHLNKPFKEIKKEALAGSDYDESWWSPYLTFDFIFSVIKVIAFFVIFGLLLFFGSKWNRSGTPNLSNIKRQKFQRKYKEQYYRDYPYEGYYLNAYYITYTMGLSDFKTLFTSLLLKWINEDRIHMEIDEQSGFFRRKSKTKLTILNDEIDPDSIEDELFQMIKNVANKDGTLDENKFSRWINRNHKKLRAWENRIIKESVYELELDDFMKSEEKRVLFMKQKQYSLTDAGKKVEENTYKYVNYLYDFSLLNEHEAINVKLWDDIMVWAAYLNLTDVVSKQFAALYPKYDEESIYRQTSLSATTTFAHQAHRSRVKSEERERRRAQRARSRGRGGRASRGGGGGSFGGGRGGGTR